MGRKHVQFLHYINTSFAISAKATDLGISE